MHHNGFDSQASLDFARRLVLEACGFPRAGAALAGLDVFYEPFGPAARIAPCGVVLGSPTPKDLADSLAGSLGRFLLKIAHTAPERKAGDEAEPWINPVAVKPEPKPEMPSLAIEVSPTPTPTPTPSATENISSKAPESVTLSDKNKVSQPAAAAFGSQSNSSFFDEQDDDPEGLLFDPDDIPEPAQYTLVGGPAPKSQEQAPSAPVAKILPPMTRAEILAMKGAFGLASSSALESFFAKIAESKTPSFSIRKPSWDSWGGSAKRSARTACSTLGMRLEVAPADALLGGKTFAIFPIEPASPPPELSENCEPAAIAEALRALESDLDAALAGAMRSASSCGASAVFLCGWGRHAEMARARAISLGFTEAICPA